MLLHGLIVKLPAAVWTWGSIRGSGLLILLRITVGRGNVGVAEIVSIKVGLFSSHLDLTRVLLTVKIVATEIGVVVLRGVIKVEFSLLSWTVSYRRFASPNGVVSLSMAPILIGRVNVHVDILGLLTYIFIAAVEDL